MKQVVAATLLCVPLGGCVAFLAGGVAGLFAPAAIEHGIVTGAASATAQIAVKRAWTKHMIKVCRKDPRRAGCHEYVYYRKR